MLWRSISFTIAITATIETARQRIVRRRLEPVNGHFHQTSGTMAAKNGSVASSNGEYPSWSNAFTSAPGSMTAHVASKAATRTNHRTGAEYQRVIKESFMANIIP